MQPYYNSQTFGVLEPQFVTVKKNTGDTKSIQHPMMPKTKLCALTNVTVNTTPLGQLQTIFDGNIPLVLLSLKFMKQLLLQETTWKVLVKVKMIDSSDLQN